MLEISKPELAKLKRERSERVESRYSLKPHEKRLLAEMAGRAKKIDRELVEALSVHFKVAKKVVVEVLAHHRMDLSALAAPTQGDEAKGEGSGRKKLKLKIGAKTGEGEAKPAKTSGVKAAKTPKEAEPVSDREWVKKQRSEIAIEQSVLERKRVELERRERELLAREKEIEARADVMDETRLEPVEETGEAEVLDLPERDPDAQQVTLHTKGMWLQSLLVREAKIAELRMELDRALELLEQRQAEPAPAPKVIVKEMPGVGPVKVFGDWYMRRREDRGE